MQKILIITGGNKGIGAGIVNAYQQHGYQIYSIARSKNTAQNFDEFNRSSATSANPKGSKSCCPVSSIALTPIKSNTFH